jgi:zinc transporter ZupT
MEGLPLGFNYRSAATNPSLYLAVGAHKLPETILLGILLHSVYGRARTITLLFIFSLITPVAAMISAQLGMHYGAVARTVTALIPVVAGAFIHISTTIFFESGTRQHMLTSRKIVAMLSGIIVAALTLLLE